MDSLGKEITTSMKMVLTYEDKNLQDFAISHIPLELLRTKVDDKLRSIKKESSNDYIFSMNKELIFLKELVKWFKEDFFVWFESPFCDDCNKSMEFIGYDEVGALDELNVSAIELFKCSICSTVFPFPRYIDAKILLSTRSGRCSEWTQVFCLFCRSLGWRTRYVLDISDHVWTEVYSDIQKRWIHCDSCEAAVDTPLMYELGWKKKLCVAIGIGIDDIQDVTWRYSCDHNAIRSRRSRQLEKELLRNIIAWRKELQLKIPPEQRKNLLICLAEELAELLIEPKPINNHEGRTSGSESWRINRGESTPDSLLKSILTTKVECAEEKEKGFVWNPLPSEVSKKEMNIYYFCAKDHYSREDGIFLKSWEKYAFEHVSLFRKVEHDWKKVYLAREGNDQEGKIAWKISTKGTHVRIDKVDLKCVIFTVSSGQIIWEISNGVSSSHLENVDNYQTTQFSGSEEISITAKVCGGEGTVAWQHAQLFRQDMTDEEYSFHLMVTLIDNSESKDSSTKEEP